MRQTIRKEANPGQAGALRKPLKDRNIGKKISGSSSMDESVKPGGIGSSLEDAFKSMAVLWQSDDFVRRALITRIMRAVTHALSDAGEANLQHALEAPTDTGSLARLLSMGADLEDAVRELDPMAAAIIRGADMKQDLLRQAGGALETSDVADLLGISKQAVVKRVQSGALLAIPSASGHLRFPAFQFSAEGTIDGLKQVLTAFNVDSPWTRLAVLLDTDEAVGDRRLIDALRAGELQGVLDVVRAFGA